MSIVRCEAGGGCANIPFDMTKVVIQPGLLRHHTGRTSAGRSVIAQARSGEALRDLCDDTRAPVPFSCRSGRCGTCFVEVLEGAEHLSPVGEDESEVLVTLGVAVEPPEGDPRPTYRLACQAVVEVEGKLIKLRVAALRRP
jgi:ferredoxin